MAHVSRLALARALLRQGWSLQQAAAKVGVTPAGLDIALWAYLCRLPDEPGLRRHA